jgi:hypothetical protein
MEPSCSLAKSPACATKNATAGQAILTLLNCIKTQITQLSGFVFKIGSQ